MDTEYLQKRFDQLMRIAQHVRHHQIRYFKYHTSVDLDKARYYEKQMDKILKEENDKKTSQQKEIFEG